MIVVATVAIAYLPALRCNFVWNDGDYVTQPQLRSWSGLWRIWTEPGATEQYYPVLHGAFWLQHRLWGDAAVGYHAANILLHAAAACLLVLLLGRLCPGRSPLVPWLAGLLFALHPVCVESVAWISEEKNTLSAVFCLGAALVYLGRGYWLASVLFVLALLSKTTTAVLPAVLLIVCWWQRGRLEWRRDVAPLVPWFAMAAAAGIFASWVEGKYVGAQGGVFSLGAGERCLLAGRAFWFYIGKLLWPADLIFFYPRWRIDPSSWRQYIGLAAGLALLAACWIARRRHRGALALVLAFGLSLLPTLGFLNVYGSLFSYVADHWAYLAVPVAAAAAAGAWGAWSRRATAAPRAAAALVLAILGVLTWRQIPAYKDEGTLYRSILARNPDAWLARSNLGILLARSGRIEEAIAQYEQALRLYPENAEAHNNLGNALVRTGQLDRGAAQYGEALRLQPHFAEAHNGLGNALFKQGRFAEAAAEYREAAREAPAVAEIRFNLGLALYRAGQAAEAAGECEEALRLRPDYPEARQVLTAAQGSLQRRPR